MRCWNCGVELSEDELDIDPFPMKDFLTGLKIYDCYCPHCGAVIDSFTEEELY